MTNGEIQAVSIADRWASDISQINKLKKLGEELIEFTEAVLNKTPKDMREEAGDMCFLILHILSKEMTQDEINLTTLVMNASDKMEMRNYKQYKR